MADDAGIRPGAPHGRALRDLNYYPAAEWLELLWDACDLLEPVLGGPEAALEACGESVCRYFLDSLVGILTPGVNLVRATFSDPEVRSLRGDWEAIARGVVARLRGLVGTDFDDPHLAELVDELSASSEQFRRLWARHDVDVVTLPTSHVIIHPLVGPIELLTETLAITATQGQFLIIYHAEPGSRSQQALTRVAGMAAGEHFEDA